MLFNDLLHSPYCHQTHTFVNRSTSSARGQTLIEVIAAGAILLIGITGISNGFLAFTIRNRRTELNSDSTAAARAVLDELRLSDVETLPNGGVQQVCNPTSPNATNFMCMPFSSALIQPGTVVVTYCPNRADNSKEYCDSSVTSRRHLEVEVYETDEAGGTQVAFTTETVFANLREL
ncbi:MAG: type II secretion system protein [Cyanobacteria bacterium P01_F01_bin.53]